MVEIFEFRAIVGGQLFDLVAVGVQRVAGDIKPQGLFFPGQLLLFRPFGRVGQNVVGTSVAGVKAGKQPMLPCGAVPRCALAELDSTVERRCQLATMSTEGIHGPGFDGAFQHALIEMFPVVGLAEMEQGIERPCFFSSLEDGVHRRPSDVLDGPEPEADRIVARGRKVPVAGVEVRG